VAHWLLTPLVGDGTDRNRWRPPVDGDWTAIDLSPPGAAGLMVVRTAGRPGRLARNVLHLSDDLDARLPARLVRRLEDRLTVTLTERRRLRGVLAELLVVHGRHDGRRWRPCRPGRRGLVEIWCGELVYAAPPIQAVGYTESFNQADSSVLGPDLTWTEVQNDWQTVSNRATPRTNNSGAAARAEHDLDSDDHYVGAPVRYATSVSGVIGVTARFDSASQTYYRAALDSAGRLDITRTVNGSNTDIASQSRSIAADVDYFIQLEVDGSTIRARVDSDVWLSTTDTQIAGNLRFGLAGYRTNRDLLVDWLTARDLGVGQAVEGDVAQPVRPVRIIPVGQAVEADTAQPVGTAKTAVVGQAAEADAARPVTADRAVTAGQAAEADVAQPVSAGKTATVGQPSESDQAQQVGTAKAAAVGQPVETDTARPVVPNRRIAVNQTVEADTAQPVAAAKTVAAGQAVESDTARPLTPRRTVLIGQADEADQAQPVTEAGGQTVPVGQAAETDTAQPATPNRIIATGQAAEADTARPVVAGRHITVSQAVETSLARALTALRSRIIGQAAETDTAWSVAATGGTPPPTSVEPGDNAVDRIGVDHRPVGITAAASDPVDTLASAAAAIGRATADDAATRIEGG